MSNISDEETRRSSWNSHSPFVNDSQPTSTTNRNDVYGGGIPQAGAQGNNLRYHHSAANFPLHPIAANGNYLKVIATPTTTNFNNYQLFSNNSSSSLPPPAANTRSDENLINNGIENVQPIYGSNGTTTNMIINQLVTNWSPNLTGNYSPFGGEENTNQHHMNKVNSNVSYQPDVMEQSTSSLLNVSNTNGSFEKQPVRPLPEVKKRIVAEVKPMRMSYSDVLSKFNNNQSPNNTANVVETTTSGKPTKNGNDKLKANQLQHERKTATSADDKEKMEFRSGKKLEGFPTSKIEDGNGFVQNGFQQREKKRSPTHEVKETNSNLNGKTQKKINNSKSGKAKPGNITQPDNGKKRSSSKRELDDNNDGKTTKSTSQSNMNNDKECYYNVTKADSNYERPQKINQLTNTKKSRQPNYSGISASKATNKPSHSRRNQQKPQTNRTSELIWKLLEKWLEYTIKIMTWLFYLVYDIVVLGCCVVFEHLCYYYSNSHIYLSVIRREWKNNSDRPIIWLKGTLRKLDNKFKKDSKWAFWRRFYKKKREETISDSYKQGRLPQTGDEAMTSLLNCKGKDAYSILGVPADSPQELIRKHYKKIAVLVHPDKNKQAGAEEAFKVLQRAFELIGEPENRKSYDQSLVEALHAEKAWSELNDLLSQLQTKITEAANTIRCSSCGLRHPRKLTERPHYAARECSFCKIRHSAREGDIWAETTYYGFRWKYLALMEGKVYDITEWVKCQKGALAHLQPNSHVVQYRIVRGQQQQQQQQQQSHQSQPEKDKFKREPPSEPSLDEFLDNLYSGQNPQHPQSSTKRRARRN